MKVALMEADEFRHRLASVAGPDRYRRFLAALNRRCRWHKRFLYWQESLIAEAGVTAPSPIELFAMVEPLLRVCVCHGVELQLDPDGLAVRCRGSVTSYTIAQSQFFPNTDCGPLRPGDPFNNIRDGQWFCPECREAEARWKGNFSQHLP